MFNRGYENYFRCDCIVGKTGSGKTFYAIKEMINFKKKYPEGVIYTNIPCNNVETVSLGRLDSLLHAQSTVPRLIVFDEFGAVLWGDVEYSKLASFLAQTRKGAGTRWLFIAQDMNMIDSRIRRLTHFIYDIKPVFFGIKRCERVEQAVYQRFYSVGGADTKNGLLRKHVSVSIYRVWGRELSWFDSSSFIPLPSFSQGGNGEPKGETEGGSGLPETLGALWSLPPLLDKGGELRT